MTSRRALIVSAHPEATSFNASLVRLASRELESLDYKVCISDLYATNFVPVESPSHFTHRVNPDRFNVQAEQRHAWETGCLPPEVQQEMKRLCDADLLILQFPFWWYGAPAILKGWIERVFIYGGVYSGSQLFSSGAFRGKRALISTTLGSPEHLCKPGQLQGDPRVHLWPLIQTLYATGYEVLDPLLLFGITSAPVPYKQAHMKRQQEKFIAAIRTADSRAALPLNRDREHCGNFHAATPIWPY
ncbi:TPA: NAD(P)H-dependent oxidoreductase [Kluyvera ascorbata]|uniref:NAD(P)H-dependent oxidoreductase n=1 Tax=Enterobacteriaceae TaxID=543 RepID=UPI00165E397B|nr:MULTISPECIES: NAD(P)H-dependent oxidoreductase [Enterobacteriaceae]MCB3711907.1 NAD(P)H-dependent oxidoreductase [Klebsiella pneumoniae]MEB8610313.1 NAD(P)H-dependent oxidoreductase [Cronobacter sakazakii]WNU05726.1 NAD(P)H-dependent oxidoreductase [Citrobacter freundii]HAT7516940.1 NAD(P)H-dependent oxidoreductase [Kluyvera ascorbata]